MSMKPKFNTPKKIKNISTKDFFNHVRTIPFPEDEEVRIEDYNSKEIRRVFRILRERQERG